MVVIKKTYCNFVHSFVEVLRRAIVSNHGVSFGWLSLWTPSVAHLGLHRFECLIMRVNHYNDTVKSHAGPSPLLKLNDDDENSS